jgi:hypothetical protein
MKTPSMALPCAGPKTTSYNEYPPLCRFAVHDMRRTVAVGVIKSVEKTETGGELFIRSCMLPKMKTPSMTLPCAGPKTASYNEYPPLCRFAVHDMRRTVAVGVIKSVEKTETGGELFIRSRKKL